MSKKSSKKEKDQYAERELSLSEKRLAKGIAYLKSKGLLVLCKLIFKKPDYTDDLSTMFSYHSHVVGKEIPLEESVELSSQEYWVLRYYDGHSKPHFAITPEWVSEEDEFQWRLKWNSGASTYLPGNELDNNWKKDCGEHLIKAVRQYKGEATTRNFVFQTKDGKFIPATAPYDMLVDHEEWPNRDETFRIEKSFIEGNDEINSILAERVYTLLEQAMGILNPQGFGLNEDQEMALAHAFMAGREAEKFDAFGNREFAKKGAPLVIKQFGKENPAPPKQLKTWQSTVDKIHEEWPEGKPKGIFEYMLEHGHISKHPTREKFRFLNNKNWVDRRSVEKAIRDKIKKNGRSVHVMAKVCTSIKPPLSTG